MENTQKEAKCYFERENNSQDTVESGNQNTRAVATSRLIDDVLARETVEVVIDKPQTVGRYTQTFITMGSVFNSDTPARRALKRHMSQDDTEELEGFLETTAKKQKLSEDSDDDLAILNPLWINVDFMHAVNDRAIETVFRKYDGKLSDELKLAVLEQYKRMMSETYGESTEVTRNTSSSSSSSSSSSEDETEISKTKKQVTIDAHY